MAAIHFLGAPESASLTESVLTTIDYMLRSLVLLTCSAPFLFAQGDAIRTMMKDSADAWNRGDLPAFAAYYENSPETTFMGKEVVRGGVAAILERYRKAALTNAIRNAPSSPCLK